MKIHHVAIPFAFILSLFPAAGDSSADDGDVSFDQNGARTALSVIEARSGDNLPRSLESRIDERKPSGWFSLDSEELGKPWDGGSGMLSENGKSLVVGIRKVFSNDQNTTAPDCAFSFRDRLLETLSDAFGCRPETYEIPGEPVALAEACGLQQEHLWLRGDSIIRLALIVDSSSTTFISLGVSSQDRLLKGMARVRLRRVGKTPDPEGEILKFARPVSQEIDGEKFIASLLRDSSTQHSDKPDRQPASDDGVESAGQAPDQPRPRIPPARPRGSRPQNPSWKTWHIAVAVVLVLGFAAVLMMKRK